MTLSLDLLSLTVWYLSAWWVVGGGWWVAGGGWWYGLQIVHRGGVCWWWVGVSWLVSCHVFPKARFNELDRQVGLAGVRSHLHVYHTQILNWAAYEDEAGMVRPLVFAVSFE